MNPILSEMAKRIQEKANTYIPQAYGMGRAKVQEKYGAVKPWGLQDTVNVELLLNRHAEELSRSMVKIEQAVAEGVGIDILLDQFLNRVGAWAWVLSPALASGMAAGIDSGRTEIGQEEGLESNDIGIIWLTAEDARVCDKCLYMAGRWFEAKNAYEIAASIHPGCLLPENQVLPLGLEAMTRAWYDGIVYEIKTREGHSFTVTPNHPILTPYGFIAASQLCEGDDVISCLNTERMVGLTDPNNNNVPTPIKEIWDSLSISLEETRRSVPVTPIDFHGDAGCFNGDVDVIYTKSLLLSEYNPFFSEHMRQRELIRMGMGEQFFTGNRPLLSFFDSRMSPFSGDMGSSTSRITFGLGHARKTEFVGLAPIARFNAGMNQLNSDFLTGDFKGFGDSQFGLSVLVHGDHFRYGNKSLKGRDTTTLALCEKPSISYTELAAQFIRRFSSLVTAEKIISIRNYLFSGHVYDLQSSQSLYICNNIIVKNCRCPAHFDVGVPSDAMVGPVPSYQPGTADMVYRDLHADSLIKQRWERARRPAMATPQPMAPIPI